MLLQDCMIYYLNNFIYQYVQTTRIYVAWSYIVTCDDILMYKIYVHSPAEYIPTTVKTLSLVLLCICTIGYINYIRSVWLWLT